MSFDQITQTPTTWRQMGGSKLTILGGEPTLHPHYLDVIRKFRRMRPDDFAYLQISLDGGSATSHDQVRGTGTFDQSLRNIAELVERGFDTRNHAPCVTRQLELPNKLTTPSPEPCEH